MCLSVVFFAIGAVLFGAAVCLAAASTIERAPAPRRPVSADGTIARALCAFVERSAQR